MKRLYGPYTTAAAAGGAGVATGTIRTPEMIEGRIDAVYVKYNDAPPAGTTDVIIKAPGVAGKLPELPILTITNAATDGYFIPRKQTVSQANAANAGDFEPVNVADQITITMEGANNGDSATVWIYVF